jgi:hypothetical protein
MGALALDLEGQGEISSRVLYLVPETLLLVVHVCSTRGPRTVVELDEGPHAFSVETFRFREVANVEFNSYLGPEPTHSKVVPRQMSTGVRVDSHEQIELVLTDLDGQVQVAPFENAVEHH